MISQQFARNPAFIYIKKNKKFNFFFCNILKHNFSTKQPEYGYLIFWNQSQNCPLICIKFSSANLTKSFSLF